MKEMPRTKYVGEPLSQHIHVFTNPEAPQIHTIRDFLEASSCKQDRLLTSFSAPLPSLESGGVG